MYYTHSGLANETKCFYSAFAHDASLNYAPRVMASATPRAGAHSVIDGSSFASDSDGWTTSVWKAGTSYNPGVMAWNGSAGNPDGGMRCNGNGGTDNLDTCTREGGEIRKVISTAGYTNIRIAYDLRVNSLGVDNTGGGTGGCADDHSLIDDQLTVYYSTNSGISWMELDWLPREDLLNDYMTYGTRVIDLSGLKVVNDNPSFALRFRWQFNAGIDTGELDNVVVMGRAVVPPVSIPHAKGLPDGQARPLHGKVVSGVFGDCFYIQEPASCSGLRVIPAVNVLPGQGVDLMGAILGQGAERYLDLAGGSIEVFTPGPLGAFPW
jgi:hypothetical protein